MRHSDLPGIRSGKLPELPYAMTAPRLGLRLRTEGWGCCLSINGEWIPVGSVRFEATASSGPPQVMISIPAVDLVIETETQRAADAA